MISNLKSRRYFFAFFRLEKASATRTWAGGCEAPDTRAPVRTVAFAFLLREAGTWGLKKNSKMAAVMHRGIKVVFFYRVSCISKVCSHCLFELQSSIVLFLDVALVFLEAYLFFPRSFYIVYASSYSIFHKNTKLGS